MTWRWTVIADWVRKIDPKRGAEIGVKEGRFITHMLNCYPDLVMYAVDPWEPQPSSNEKYDEWDFNIIYNEYKAKTVHVTNRIVELREYSETAAAKVEDRSLDFVFIDAQHDYDSVKRDIELWHPKVRPGGLLSGHDYEPNFQGVINAVNEAFPDPLVGTNAVWGHWC